METKIRNFLQSDFFILSIALLMGFLCHFFVTTEILTSDKKAKNTQENKITIKTSKLKLTNT